MLISKRIKLYFSLVSLTAVLLTSLIIGYLVHTLTVNIITNEKQKGLEVFRDLKAFEIENYFKQIKSESLVLSNNSTIINALTKFNDAFKNFPKSKENTMLYQNNYQKYLNDFKQEYIKKNGDGNYDPKILLQLVNDDSIHIQQKYVIDNLNKFSKDKTKYKVEDDSEYGKVHNQYNEYITKIKEKLNFYDIFLINNNGDIVYNVSKEMDFGASLKQDYLATSSLGAVFTGALNAKDDNYVAVSDFNPYLPSLGLESAFIATPVVDKNGERIGVLAFELSIDAINTIMTSNYNWEDVGLGKTGEVYLLGPNYEFRSISRYLVEDLNKYLTTMEKVGMSKAALIKIRNRKNNIGIQVNKSKGALAAFNNREGFQIYKDYRNIEVLSSYKPLNIPELNWVILAEIDKKEAYAPVNKLKKELILFSILIAIVLSLFGWYISSLLTDVIMLPVKRYCKVITQIAKSKNLTKRIEVKTDDELGYMAKALNKLLESFQNSCKTTLKSAKIMHETADNLQKLVAKREKEKIEMKDKKEEKKITKENFDYDKDVQKASSELEALSGKLKTISEEFEFLEEEAEKRSYW